LPPVRLSIKIDSRMWRSTDIRRRECRFPSMAFQAGYGAG